MSTMKKFLIYLLLVLAVVGLTDIIAKLVLETNYKDIIKYEIATVSPEIKVNEAKAGRVNARIKGNVTNKTESLMENIIIKIELKSKLNHTLGAEYLKMGNFEPGQTKDFSANCKYSDIDSFIIGAVDHVEEVNSIEQDPVYQNMKKYYPIARLVAWCIAPAIYLIPFFLLTWN